MILFDLAKVDRVRLEQARGVLMSIRKADNTEIAYASGYSLFAAWCFEMQLSPLPATEDTMALYTAYLLEEKRYRVSTARVKLCGIAHRHRVAGYPNPFDYKIREMLSNAARLRKERRQYKQAITLEHVRRAASLLANDDDLQSIRDRAVFILGFALGWRRSEVVSLDYADVTFAAKGVILYLAASKTDQTGKGRIVSIPFGEREETCPVRNLERWIEARGRWRGALFCRIRQGGTVLEQRLSGHWMCRKVQEILERIGEEQPRAFGAHSLRSGMITTAAENGADPIAIMQRTGHESITTVMRYIRPSQGFRVDPLKGVL
jgi:integrase